MNRTILKINNIGKEFNGIPVLQNVCFEVAESSVHAIVGENGAGKSTLMNILSGIYPYGTYSGEFFFDGEQCRFRTVSDSEKKGISIVHQELALVPNLSIGENIFLGNEKRNGPCINWDKTFLEAEKILKMVDIHEPADTPLGVLGTGKQQLVEIAKALAKKGRLLILDEPTASLNDAESKKLLDLIIQLKEKGITSIIISHKLKEIAYAADRITVIRDGRTIETIENPEKSIDEDKIINGMIGREMTSRYPEKKYLKPGDVSFEVKNWNVFSDTAHEKKAADNVSFYARRGEIVGFYGLQGAGRTELAMSLFGSSYGTNITGEMYINGKRKYFRSPKEAVESGFVYVSEDRAGLGLILSAPVTINTTLANLDKLRKKFGVIDKFTEREVAKEYSDSLHIHTPSIHAQTSTLSGGNQQKVLLAKWMFADPEIIILDEPTRGIDVGAKYEIYCIINQLIEEGKTIIVISSDLSELFGIADRIYIMCDGRIIDETTPDSATQESIMTSILAAEARNNNIRETDNE